MKSTLLILFLLILVLDASSQPSKFADQEPANMVFVPQGSFVFRNDNISKTLSVDAFWMSNEITNKEYMEFTDYAKQHPGDTLSWLDFSTSGENKDLRKNMKSCTLLQICSNLIDTFALQKEYPANSEEFKKYKNYFTDKNFENYPAVGITHDAARLYCVWRTNMENKKMKSKGLPYVQDYRLPQESEWLYVADICKGSEEKRNKGIQEVISGKENKLGLYFLFGNVAEWTANSETDKIAVRGGYWKAVTPDQNRMLVGKEVRTGYIGFRIIRSYLGRSK